MGTLGQPSQLLVPATGIEYEFVGNNQRTKFLATPLGEQLEYFVRFDDNFLQVYNVLYETAVHSFDFPSDSKIIDVDYFPTKDGSFGVIVAVNDEKCTWEAENFVVALHVDENSSKKLKISHSLEIPEHVTILKTLFTNEDMDKRRQEFKLFSRIARWPHIIAIGAKNSKCFIGRLLEHSPEDEAYTVKHDSSKLVNFLGSLVLRSGETFRYAVNDVHKDYPVSAISVTSLALMPRSRTLLVGLSMGGIVCASLNPSNSLQILDLRHERCIRHIVPLEPEDDPEKYEFFFAAADGSPRHPLIIHLYRGNFKSEEEVSEESRYDRPFFYIVFEHAFKFSKKWIAIKGLTQQRAIGNGLGYQRTRSNEDSFAEINSSSLLNSSISFGSSLKRSMVFFVYEKIDITQKGSTLAGAIFDIDQYYYKRTPQCFLPDKTILRQCPFLSSIQSDISSADVHEACILLNQPTDISKFVSNVSDGDQLFYASALNFDRVIIGTSSSIMRMRISSIQDNSVLNSQAADLSAHEKIVLSGMLYNGKVDDVIRTLTGLMFESSRRMDIIMWAFYECCDFRNTIIDRIADVFEGTSMNLSPIANGVIYQGIQLFHDVHKLLLACIDVMKDSTKVKKCATSIKCFHDHTRLVRQFIIAGIVPKNTRITRKMKDAHTIRVRTAGQNGKGLPIQILVRRLHSFTSSLPFWDSIPHDQWYPPSAFHLLEPILERNVPEGMKRELIIQFIVDWIRAKRYGEPLTVEEIIKQALFTIGDQFLGTTHERIAFVLENEKFALQDFNKKNVFNADDSTICPNDETRKNDTSIMDPWTKQIEDQFEQRYRCSKTKTKVLTDDENDSRYQTFLMSRQKYSDLSKNFVNSNGMLRKLLPNVIKSKANSDKTGSDSKKEDDIRSVVKAMISRGKHGDVTLNTGSKPTGVPALASIPQPTKLLTNKAQNSTTGRKRLLVDTKNDDKVTSPSGTEPPLAKRRSQQFENDKNSGDVAPAQVPCDEDDEMLNAVTRTPARYLRRFTQRVDELSPTERMVPPTISIAPSSILKTAKSQQSPSRGRIRFAKGLKSSPDQDLFANDEKSVVKSLNFDILEEDDAGSTFVSCDTANDKETDQDECIETEKSFEEQIEEFEVYTDATPPQNASNAPIEASVEAQEDEVNSDENADIAKKQTEGEQHKQTEKTNEIAEDNEMEVGDAGEEVSKKVEEPEERIFEKTFEVADELPSKEIEKSVEIAEDIVEREELEEVVEREEESEKKEIVDIESEVFSEPIVDAPEIAGKIDEPNAEQAEPSGDVEMMETDDHDQNEHNGTFTVHVDKDGFERSFEKQMDSDLVEKEAAKFAAPSNEASRPNSSASGFIQTDLTNTTTRVTRLQSRTSSFSEERIISPELKLALEENASVKPDAVVSQKTPSKKPAKERKTPVRSSSRARSTDKESEMTIQTPRRSSRSRTASACQTVTAVEKKAIPEETEPVEAPTPRKSARSRNTSIGRAADQIVSNETKEESETVIAKKTPRKSARSRQSSVPVDLAVNNQPTEAVPTPKSGRRARSVSTSRNDPITIEPSEVMEMISEEPTTPKRGRVSKSPARARSVSTSRKAAASTNSDNVIEVIPSEEPEPVTPSRRGRPRKAANSESHDVIVEPVRSSKRITRASSEKPTSNWRSKFENALVQANQKIPKRSNKKSDDEVAPQSRTRTPSVSLRGSVSRIRSPSRKSAKIDELEECDATEETTTPRRSARRLGTPRL
ncbi:unnamed protein product [Caenorhabditis bovis]|uniref:ELYS beta-propeller domain-containing protein n=1 Tax=Caenorhabditis bovis TaxID=2654633 RepID=A0A8S1ES18_9PELO|nr:unnamed protein product [Caenorhabditis bovis]